MDYKYYFHTPSCFKEGDEIAVNIYGKYKKGIIASDQYIAESGVPYTNVKIKDDLYAVPTIDICSLDSVKIINEAFIFCSDRKRDVYYSMKSSYNLVFDGEVINKTRYSCYRKEANKLLLDEFILKKYNIHKVYSKGILIYNK